MRKLIIGTIALGLASLAFTGTALAQQTTTTAPAFKGTLDFGYRGSSVDGDKARWERYRDLRDGLASKVQVGKETDQYGFTLDAGNIGYHDQKYTLAYNNYGKVKFTAYWDSIPLNYAYNTMTPWRDAGNNVWTLDAALRTQVQNKVAGVLGIGSTAAHYNQASIFRSIAQVFEMKARRDTFGAALKYRLTDVLSANLAFSSTKKSGNMPYGMAFAFNDANELPMSIDNRTNDFSAALEWAKASTGMARVAWDASWFTNNFDSVLWDNPLRATNYDSGKLATSTTSGPWDNSGYSNGNGPAQGRMSLPPDNSMNTWSFLGMYKMPGHSTINGQFALITMKQNDNLIPWTTNALLTTPAVYKYFPGLATLRQTAEAEVKGKAAVVNFNSRPNKYFGFDMRYRYNDHKNQSEEFMSDSNVRFDSVPEFVTSETEHFNIRRNTFEMGASFSALPNSTVKFGYIFDDVKREGRAYSNMADYTFRASIDTYGNQYVMLRGVYEITKRIGDGFSEASIEEGGAQGGLRFYDEADMDRTKGSLVLSITPTQKMELAAVFAQGKDEYKGEGHYFGLLNNDNTSYTLNLNFYPTDQIAFGGNWGREKFESTQRSRNANPLSGVAGAYESWTDPNRDWNLDNDETVNTWGLYMDLIQALKNTDIRFTYDFSDSDQAFVHYGPRIDALRGNLILTTGDSKPCATGITSCFEALPNVTNKWQQAKVDVKHMITPKVGLGFGYWYEKFDVTDFATTNLADGSPRIDPLGAITTGYGNRPYKGQTGMVRLIVVF